MKARRSFFLFLVIAALFLAAFVPMAAQRFDWVITKRLTVLKGGIALNSAVDINDAVTIDGGLTDIGGGSYATANGDNDLGIAGDLEVDGTTDLDGLLSGVYNVENIAFPSVITATVPYTPATGTVATIGDGELWLVHKVFLRVDTNFDCTGDNCTLTIGDGNVAAGFINAVDANLQTTFTEATGYAAGYYGIENGSNGAYTVDDGGPFVYAPSGAAETIDYAVGGTSPAAGSATVFIIYTRLQ